MPGLLELVLGLAGLVSAGEIVSLICSFCLSVAASAVVPSRFIPDTHKHVAGTSSNIQTTTNIL